MSAGSARAHRGDRGRAATAAALVAVLLLARPGSCAARRRRQPRPALMAEARLMARVVEEPLARGRGRSASSTPSSTPPRARSTRASRSSPPTAACSPTPPLSGRRAAPRSRTTATGPEVRERAGAGRGSSPCGTARPSDDDLLYVAVPIRRGGRLVGVSRVARRCAGRAGAGARALAQRGDRLGPGASPSRSRPRCSLAALARRSAGRCTRSWTPRASFAAGDLAARSRVRARGRARASWRGSSTTPPTSSSGGSRRSRATAAAPTPSSPPWTTACSRSTTGASCCSPTRA